MTASTATAANLRPRQRPRISRQSCARKSATAFTYRSRRSRYSKTWRRRLLASKESLRPGTWCNVDVILRQHLLRRWGDVRLDYVAVPDIEAWARELIQKRSAGTLRNVMGVGGEIFD